MKNVNIRWYSKVHLYVNYRAKEEDKLWFDESCRSVRNECLHTLNRFIRYRTNVDRECKVTCEKESSKKRWNFINWEGILLSYMREYNLKPFFMKDLEKRKITYIQNIFTLSSSIQLVVESYLECCNA